MGIFDKFKKNEKNSDPGKILKNTEGENEENTEEEPGKFNVIGKVKKKKEEHNAEKEAYDSLAPYLRNNFV